MAVFRLTHGPDLGSGHRAKGSVNYKIEVRVIDLEGTVIVHP